MQKRVLNSKQFYEPLIQVLGEAAGYTAGAMVPFSNDLAHQIIWATGFDPDRLESYGDPQEGWCYRGVSKPVGMKRRIILAYLSLHRDDQPYKYTIIGIRGMWGLTEVGVAAARRLGPYRRMPNKRTRNATSQYLDQKIRQTKGEFLSTLRKAIAACLPQDGVERIDDHVQTFLTRLISRDSLRSRIESGMPLEDRWFVQWVVNSAKTDIRGEGTDPVSREFRGARTYRERLKGPAQKGRLIDDPRVIFSQGDSDSGVEMDIVETKSSLDDLQDQIQFKTLIERLAHKLATRHPNARHGLRCLRILEMQMRGLSLKEIGEVEGVTSVRASSLLTAARATIRKMAPTPDDLQLLLS